MWQQRGKGGEHQLRVERVHHVARAEEDGRADPEVLGLARDRHLAGERQGLAQQECQKGSFKVGVSLFENPDFLTEKLSGKSHILCPWHRIKFCS